MIAFLYVRKEVATVWEKPVDSLFRTQNSLPLNTKTAVSSEAFVPFYQTIRHHIDGRQNLTPHDTSLVSCATMLFSCLLTLQQLRLQ
jgi:hypothetical protein